MSPESTTLAGVEERRHPMSVSLTGRVALRALMEQAWQQVEGQAREMLKRAVEGLLGAERDRRVAEAKQRGEKLYRWGYTCLLYTSPSPRD